MNRLIHLIQYYWTEHTFGVIVLILLIAIETTHFVKSQSKISKRVQQAEDTWEEDKERIKKLEKEIEKLKEDKMAFTKKELKELRDWAG